MSSYSDFAVVYDTLMQNADYDKRTEYLMKLFKKYRKKPGLMLDLACGTGAFSIRFAKKGVEVIGVDISEEMLSVARENSAQNGTDVLFLCQPAQKLDLYGTVDSAVCCMDSINHITDENKLKQAFSRVSLFMEPGGLFIFDVNTLYKHRQILANNTFTFDENGIFCVWKNEYNEKKRITDITLDFFVEEDGHYERLGEHFCERCYTTDELCDMLGLCGFGVEEILGDMSFEAPTETDERLYIVAKKL